MEKVTMNMFKTEAIKRKMEDLKRKFNENRDMIIMMAPIGAAAIGTLCKGVFLIVKRSNLNKEKELKENYCYDRSLGHYWALKRELTNSEWLEIDRRKNDGEKLGDILESLKVLK